jgi:hypothetical protein
LIENLEKNLLRIDRGITIVRNFLLELANVVLMKIYYMGVAGHDLASNYQEAHD